MRGRQVGFITLLFVANVGVLAWLALTVVVNQGPPLIPLLVTAASFPSPLPDHANQRTDASVVTPAPSATLAEVALISPTAQDAAAEAPTSAPPYAAPADATSAPDIAPGVTSLEDLPASAAVSGVVGHRQSLPLSCESRSAVDWAAFFGVRLDELEFLGKLPTSDDPDRGFVGDVHGAWGQTPPNAYGVHAGPVAKLLTAYGVPATSTRYAKWSLVQREVAAGRPVMVWVAGHVEAGHTAQVYVAGDGRQTIVAAFEHTVIVIGYTPDTVTIVDGARVYTRPLIDFLDSWGALRNMAVTFDGA